MINNAPVKPPNLSVPAWNRIRVRLNEYSQVISHFRVRTIIKLENVSARHFWRIDCEIMSRNPNKFNHNEWKLIVFHLTSGSGGSRLIWPQWKRESPKIMDGKYFIIHEQGHDDFCSWQWKWACKWKTWLGVRSTLSKLFWYGCGWFGCQKIKWQILFGPFYNCAVGRAQNRFPAWTTRTDVSGIRIPTKGSRQATYFAWDWSWRIAFKFIQWGSPFWTLGYNIGNNIIAKCWIDSFSQIRHPLFLLGQFRSNWKQSHYHIRLGLRLESIWFGQQVSKTFCILIVALYSFVF